MSRMTLVLMILVTVSNSLQSQPFQFRGADRNGIYPDTGLLDSWPEEGPQLMNSISGIGDGFGSPSITDQGLFIAGMIDSTGYLHHYNPQLELQWSVPYGKEFTFKYTGARGTPTIDENRLYYSGTFGDAVCLDVKDGSTIWKKNIFKEYGGTECKWGYTESPKVPE